jgi:hypothetical protein
LPKANFIIILLPIASHEVAEIAGVNYCTQLLLGFKNVSFEPGAWWLMPVILVTQEAEIRRITVEASLGK